MRSVGWGAGKPLKKVEVPASPLRATDKPAGEVWLWAGGIECWHYLDGALVSYMRWSKNRLEVLASWVDE